MQANQENRRFQLSKDEINALPLGGFSGEIEIVGPGRSARVPLISDDGIVGFDTESRPSFRKGEFHPISVIQLATDDRAWLYRPDSSRLPDELESLIENPEVIKIAQDPKDELTELADRYDLTPRGFIDLQPIARRIGCRPAGVRGLAALFLGIRVSKSAQRSNWAEPRLNEKQQRYAATDAWVCRRVYLDMTARDLVPEDMKGRVVDVQREPRR